MLYFDYLFRSSYQDPSDKYIWMAIAAIVIGYLPKLIKDVIVFYGNFTSKKFTKTIRILNVSMVLAVVCASAVIIYAVFSAFREMRWS